ncbi:molybdenum ABC transporter molybdate-binding protein [Acidovorax temperans]|uniref:Molybdenum ABC transporter molybdate-binding protein n=1 Tax=Acidovorax temperans TaxID=80878 RepID=A0A543L2N4_9BURK|nr:molybdate ABC transporter substrate-binding protein [Acidovorax temperans]TQN01598.1 molybdenum ABC transporter molybdate-binding protein [Acidovorax temperans]
MPATRLNAWGVSSLMLGAAVLSGCATQQGAAPVKAPAAGADPVQVYAAGSLRDALIEIARDHEARTGQKVVLTLAASGLLRERIEQGAPAQVFASADTKHPQRLANQGQWQAPVVFTRNTLCALAQGTVAVTSDTLLGTMLQPQVRLGISTPKADPAGDYAWALFQKADALQPGATARLEAKALQLTGGANSAQAPAGRNTYAWVMEQNRADVFLTYCTNAVAARAEVPSLQVVAVPEALQVGAAYGLTVRAGAPAQAQAFAQAVLQPPAQAVLRRLGFAAP